MTAQASLTEHLGQAVLGGALTAEQAVQQRPADAAARQRALAAGQGNHRVLAVDVADDDLGGDHGRDGARHGGLHVSRAGPGRDC